ncbi:MAG: hypothetical protein RL240_1932 [Planctomycetota bacterium]|jgi:hypothetical protein
MQLLLIKDDLSLKKSARIHGRCIEHVARVVVLGVGALTVGLGSKMGNCGR